MSNVAIMRRMHQTGMGWPNPNSLPSDVYEDWGVISGGGENAGDGAPPWWAILGPSLITTAGTVTRDVFAPVGSTQAAYGAQHRSQLQPQQYIPLRSSSEEGIGAGLERFVRDNSTLLLIGAGLIVLIQMPGFTRRGR